MAPESQLTRLEGFDKAEGPDSSTDANGSMLDCPTGLNAVPKRWLNLGSLPFTWIQLDSGFTVHSSAACLLGNGGPGTVAG
jgi:hypothetical protein